MPSLTTLPIPGDRRIIPSFFIPGLVSVIIPSYQSKWCIEVAVLSVLQQTYQSFEIIVIDDGSTDNTGDYLFARFPNKIIYKYQENAGLARSRNEGLLLSKGEFIQFLDADDYLDRKKLEKQVSFLRGHSSIDVVSCLYREFWDKGEYPAKDSMPRFTPPASLPQLLSRNVIGPPVAPLIRRSVLVTIGGFDESFHNYCADWELWLTIALLGKEISLIPELLAYYRRHANSLTRSKVSPNALGDLKVAQRASAYLYKKPEYKLWNMRNVMYVRYKELALARLREGDRFAGLNAAVSAIRYINLRQFRKDLLSFLLLFISPSSYDRFRMK